MAALPAEKARERKKPMGSIGSRARSSQATKAAISTRAEDERAEHLGAAPAGLVAAHERPHEAEHAAGDQGEAADVEAGVGAVALAHLRQHERDRRPRRWGR